MNAVKAVSFQKSFKNQLIKMDMKLKDVYFEGKRKDNTKYSSFSIKIASDVVKLHYDFHGMEEDDDCEIDLSFDLKAYSSGIDDLIRSGKCQIPGRGGNLEIEQKNNSLVDLTLDTSLSMTNRVGKHYFINVNCVFNE